MSRTLTAKGLATRARIVEHATVLVCGHGVANVSLDSVRQAAGVSNSQLYHYFPDGKRDLMLAVARHAADTVLLEQGLSAAHLTTWRAWYAWIDLLCERFATPQSRAGLSSLIALVQQASPETSELLAGAYSRWEEHLAAGIASMQGTGKMSSHTRPAAAAAVLLAGVNGAFLIAAATGDADRLRTTLRAAVDGLRPGLA